MTDMLQGATAPRASRITFTATAWSYTKLWYVNVFLTIITLGIYGPWAKVRNNQYLYGHTSVEHHAFRYLADPLKILQGRILALGVILILAAAITFFPLLNLLTPILMLIATPWLITQGIRFTMRATSYRNVRFDFKGTTGQTFIYFLLLPFVSVFTFYLLLPWAIQQLHLYIYRNVEFGGKKVSLETTTGTYYIASILSSLVSILGAMIAIGFMVGGASISKETFMTPAIIGPLALILFISGLLAQAVFIARIRNHIINNLTIDEVSTFRSDIGVGGYLWITATNILLVMVTLGLAFPVARIRKLRYLAEHCEAQLHPGIDHLANTVSDTGNAFGEEAAGLMDTDLSII